MSFDSSENRNASRKGKLTHESLSSLNRAVSNDLSDIVLESLVEHSIRFVENEVGDPEAKKAKTRREVSFRLFPFELELPSEPSTPTSLASDPPI